MLKVSGAFVLQPGNHAGAWCCGDVRERRGNWGAGLMKFVHLLAGVAAVTPLVLPARGETALADSAVHAMSRAVITVIVIGSDGNARLEGFGRPDSVIAVRSGPATLGQVRVSASGTWTLDVGSRLSAGDHRISASANGVAGVHPAAIRVSIPDGFAGPLTIPRDERPITQRADTGSDRTLPLEVRADAEALATAATAAFSDVLMSGRYRVAQAGTSATDQSEPARQRPSTVPENDFLAPVIEWLERSSRSYQDVIVRRLSEGQAQPQQPAPVSPPQDEHAPAPATGSGIVHDALARIEQAFESIRFNAQEWLARARRTYSNEIVRPLSTPGTAVPPEFARMGEGASQVAAPPVPDNRTAEAAGDENARQEERRQAEAAAEDVRRSEEARGAKESADVARKAEEERLAALKQKEDEARRAEDLRVAQEKAAADEAARKEAEAASAAERKRLADEAEAARKTREAKLAEERRQAEEAKTAEAKRLAVLREAAARRAETQRLAEERRQKELRDARERMAAEAKRLEESRKAEMKAAEARRAQEQLAQQKAGAGDAARKADEERKAGEQDKRSVGDAQPAERRAGEARDAEQKPQGAKRPTVATNGETNAPKAESAPAQQRSVTAKKPKRHARSSQVRRKRAHHHARSQPSRRHARKARRSHSAHVHRSHRHARRHADRRAGMRGRRGAARYVVRRGDTLSRIARRYYGDPRKYRAIFRANRKRIRHPDVIRRGQRLIIPRLCR